ncbi:hypothetical protein Tco_0844094 [Tanacetum coccineum]
MASDKNLKKRFPSPSSPHPTVLGRKNGSNLSTSFKLNCLEAGGGSLEDIPRLDTSKSNTYAIKNASLKKKINNQVLLLPELHRRNRRVPYDQRNNPPQHPRIVYPLVLNINYFCHFLDILRNYDPMDDELMWATDYVVTPTPGFAITIPETANEFAIKGNHLTLVKGN